MNNAKMIVSLGLISMVALASGATEAVEIKEDGAKDSRLISTLNPALSGGYTTWTGYDNPEISYKVEYISKGAVVKTVTTPKNYYRFDLSAWKNHDFRIKAVDSNSSEVIGLGPDDHILPQNGDEWGEVTCSKICNGPDYAWQLDLIQSNQATSINSPAHLTLRPVYEPFDASPGATNPTWQAMTPAFFSANSFHYISNNYAYHQVTLPATPSASSPQIVDAYGTQMLGSTYFVQKKMEQFDYAQNNVTTTFNPSSTICDGGLTSSGGWISRFNAYPDPSNTPPTGVNDDPVLECTMSPGGYSVPSGNDVGGGSAAGVSVEFYFCSIEGLGSFMSTVPCDTYATGEGTGTNVSVGGNGNPAISSILVDNTFDNLADEGEGLSSLIDYIELDPVSTEGKTLFFKKGDEMPGLFSNMDSLKSGLYLVTVYMIDGRGYPQYIEIMNRASSAEQRG